MSTVRRSPHLQVCLQDLSAVQRAYVRAEYRRLSAEPGSGSWVAREHARVMVGLFQSPIVPGAFRSVDQIREANARAGSHFFDRSAMRSFSSRVAPGVSAGRVFITSEQDRTPYVSLPRAWNGARRYTVRFLADDGSTGDLSAFGAFASLADARRYVRRMVALGAVNA